MEPYYYNQMNKQEQNVYRKMKEGLLSLTPSFFVPRLTGKELSDIFFRLRLDHPEIFYGVSFRYRGCPGAENVEIVPEYLFQKDKIKEHRRALEARVKKLSCRAGALKEEEKERYIHDFICQNVRYDKLKKPYSHEIIGPLGHGVGVCEGIAKSVKILCDALGIWCIIAISEANPEKKIKYRHAWNIIKVGGNYYHLDVTFDHTLGKEKELRYDYFNLDDKRIFRDHEPVIYPVPRCTDGEHFFYRDKKLSFTKEEEVEKRALQAIKKKKPLIFHWRGGYLTREMLMELLDLLSRTAKEKGTFAKVGINWPQAIFHVDFSGQISEGENEIEIEEANEGEKEA